MAAAFKAIAEATTVVVALVVVFPFLGFFVASICDERLLDREELVNVKGTLFEEAGRAFFSA